MSYTVIITEEIAANVDVTTQNYPITIEYNATNIASGSTYGNANVTALLASGNVTTTIETTGDLRGGSIDSNTTIAAQGNIVTTGNIIANGQYLTNLTAANIVGAVAQATQAGTANVANSVAGANVTGVVAQATQANAANTATTAGSATTAATVTGAAQANITSVGTLTSLGVTGNITSSGNISGNFILGNGSQLTGLPATYGNANVAANLAAFGSNPISTTGNVTAGYFLGNGSQLTGLPATYGNANVADFLGNGFGSNTITTTGNITGGNIRSAVFQAVNSAGGVLRNASGTNQLQWGSGGGDNLTLDVSTNITGANAQINISPTGNSGHVHIKPTGTPSVEIAPTFTGSMNNMIIGNVTPAAVSATTVSATGNITGANVVATANLTSTQQTVIGTANVGTTGNIVISGKNIATDMAWLPDGGNAATGVNGRVVIGTGWAGNISHAAQQNRMLVSDAFNRGNTATAVRLLQADALISLTANVTNGSMRNQPVGGTMRIGGGAAANTISLGQGVGNIFSVAGGQFNVDVGNISPYNLGNTTISHAAINGGAIQIQAGSTVLNAYGINNLITSPVGGSPGNIGNIIGYSTGMILASVPSGNVYGFYHASNATASTTGVGVGNQIRQAPQYYAFYNADDHAHMQLGSLRAYHEYRGDLATTGTVDINKVNGQVQYIRPTGNVTIGSLTNFVTETTDGSTFDQHIDTVTLVIAQGATPYTITMPTGNAAIKYAGNVSTVANTANAVTMISISAANIASTKTYMVTISPEFK
jgi:hypothetical protein